ncbi:MAG: TolC family protein [Saprospiraceae bacterium]
MRIGTFHFYCSPVKLVAVVFGFLMAFDVAGQKTWTLRECIEYARDNSLSLKQAQYGIALAKLTDKQNRLSRLPNINGSVNGGFQFGRTIDPVTNSFNTQRIAFNSFGLDAGMTLFSGGRINNTIKQGKLDVEASEADAQSTFNTLALNIANAYLQILMAEEQLEGATNRRNLSQQQLDQTDKLIEAGTLPANDRLDVLAQIARDEQTIIQTQNLIDITFLNLKELMQIDPATEMQLEKPQFVIPADANPDALGFGELYSNALNTQPQIRANELRQESAEAGVNIARGALLPTLNLFGGLNTNWSSAGKIQTGSIVDTFYQEVIFENVSGEIGFPGESPIIEDNPYFDQLDQNFGQNFGLNLSIPIYNGSRNKINVQRAEVNILNAKLQSDLTKQQLKNDVQQAIANARAGRRSLAAAEKSQQAAQVAYENADKRFKLGAINNLEFITARNALDIAQTELISAKYDYLFRLKIIDFYLGRELKLD